MTDYREDLIEAGRTLHDIRKVRSEMDERLPTAINALDRSIADIENDLRHLGDRVGIPHALALSFANPVKMPV